jgi:hypothetical protein
VPVGRNRGLAGAVEADEFLGGDRMRLLREGRSGGEQQ